MLKDIKSKYILKALFGNVGKYKTLLISHRNKYLNKELEITVNDYKDVHENIEISIKLSDDPEDYKEINNRFINIHIDLLRDGFEIYFDDKITDRTYVTKNDKVSNITIKIKPQIHTFRNLFECRTCIKEINFINCVQRNITDMSYMFNGCSSLRKLDISRLRTNNVTDMSHMFYGCSLLKEINVSNFDTSKVENMEAMFKSCKSLKKLDASNFITQKVTNFSEMFYEDTDLTDLNVKIFYINNARFMDKMFYGCSSLTNLELFPLDFAPFVDKTEMTEGCPYFKDKNLI